MSTSRGPRGERGRPGPPGPRGIQGKAGAKGKDGRTGATGVEGRRGTVGKSGRGMADIREDRMEILGIVETQIEDIHRELDVQMKRMAELQMQLDDVRTKVRQLLGNSSTSGPRKTAEIETE